MEMNSLEMSNRTSISFLLNPQTRNDDSRFEVKPRRLSTSCFYCTKPFHPSDVVILKINLFFHSECLRIRSEGEWKTESQNQFLFGDVHSNPPVVEWISQDSINFPNININGKIRNIDNVLLGTQIKVNPVQYQIANYNIFPAPILYFFEGVKNNFTINTLLIESSSGQSVSNGFRAGDTQSMLSGVKNFEFSGLKLNRMGVIKSELQNIGLKAKDCYFFIRFSIDGLFLSDSEKFRIVSSFAQLPHEFQIQRPYKRVTTELKKNQNEENLEQKNRPNKINKKML